MNFRGKYNFLSNFYELPEPIVYEGVEFGTVEHAYQYAKAYHQFEKDMIAEAATPGKAKRLGKKVTMVPNWNKEKYSIMLELLWLKFQIPEMRDKLLAVDEEIVEHNEWGDTYWGICNGEGENNLGKALTHVKEGLTHLTF